MKKPPFFPEPLPPGDARIGYPSRDSYQDVRDACHRWLMKNDPSYRKSRTSKRWGNF
jgi:hypothetical protein